jgi:hypothetical protein
MDTVSYSRTIEHSLTFQVKQWLTFNEPLTFMDAYASDTGMAPSVDTPGIGDYLTAHTVILAHANIYRLYEREFREEQQGRPDAKFFGDRKTDTSILNKHKTCTNFHSHNRISITILK